MHGSSTNNNFDASLVVRERKRTHIDAHRLLLYFSFFALQAVSHTPAEWLQRQQKTGGCSGNGVIGHWEDYEQYSALQVLRALQCFASTTSATVHCKCDETFSAYAPPFLDKGFGHRRWRQYHRAYGTQVGTQLMRVCSMATPKGDSSYMVNQSNNKDNNNKLIAVAARARA